ncbi:MAG TPA: thioredoxin family protein, partial [Thauera aminoaromatica]|nr:thioredoxin family protein [Thauera aminoaromatica]
PTLALFRGGREIARQAGAMSAADIVRWVRGQLG